MVLTLPRSTLRTCLLFGIISLHMTWVGLVNKEVPKPYLDEVFHVPQAQAYWAGRWSHWDPKITTPPGLYLWSYVFNAVRRITAQNPGEMVKVEELRFSNAVAAYFMLVTLYMWTFLSGRSLRTGEEVVLQKEVVLMAFPLLAFFSGLYYTDLVSAWSVIISFVLWEAGRHQRGIWRFPYQIAHLATGLVSLTCRQTNIFWVAVFLAGLQVVDSVQDGGANKVLDDPEMGVAAIEDVFSLVFKLLPAVLSRLPSVLLGLWSHLALLASFAAFVVWNGGVVLGDKANHIATIHLPQLLYIWPCFVFFSWPTLLPQLIHPKGIRFMFPRLWLSIVIMLAMGAAVHFNTIVHPFTLADNRHYVFYVFRLLMRPWWVKYTAVPVYFVCACLTFGALRNPRQLSSNDGKSTKLSFVLIWFASTALSLVSAPLVEPRYFIVPWLVWRMHIPESDIFDEKETTTEAKGKAPKKPVVRPGLIKQVSRTLTAYSLWIELAWYILVNYVTCWTFLNRGFKWRQEPGKVQRFMW